MILGVLGSLLAVFFGNNRISREAAERTAQIVSDPNDKNESSDFSRYVPLPPYMLCFLLFIIGGQWLGFIIYPPLGERIKFAWDSIPSWQYEAMIALAISRLGIRPVDGMLGVVKQLFKK